MKKQAFQTNSEMENTMLRLFFASLLLISVIAGCSPGPVDSVKNGKLQIDESVTVGNAFEGYKFFSERSWDQFEDTQKRKIVEFKGVIPFDKLNGVSTQLGRITPKLIENTKRKLGSDKATFVVQFAILNGDEFQLKYSGLKISVKNHTTGNYEEKEIPDDNLRMIEDIYKNNYLSEITGIMILI